MTSALSRDLGALEAVLWEGCGGLLLSQKSIDSKTAKFLEAVPKHLNDIREVHGASVTGDLGVLQEKARGSREEVFSSRDRRGLTPLHKAVGLNKREAAEFLLGKAGAASLAAADCEGRTPLHYAALVGGQEGSEAVYDWLVEQGADTEVTDKQGRTPAECRGQGGQEEEAAAWDRQDSLMEVPEAPRLGQSGRKSPVKRGRSKSPVKKAGGRAASRVTKQERLAKMVAWQRWTAAQVEELARAGKVAGLEAVVLAGQGHLLDGLGKVWNEEVRGFLKKAPALRREGEEVVALVLQGDSEAVAALADARLLLARDAVGAAPVHRAARLANLEIVTLILTKLPQAVKTVDPEGRTPLHWAYRCSVV